MRVLFIFFLFIFSCNEKINRPNLVFIIVDDLGWKDVGYMGSDFYETPNIDKLSDNSTVFNSAYSASPVCSPTRASIMRLFLFYAFINLLYLTLLNLN